MDSGILEAIDREIAQLQEARALLSGHATPTPRRKVGRPAKVASPVGNLAVTPAKKKKKRNLTPEGRKRIAEAVKRRWAAQKKVASGK
jgi:hypothetical protein